MNFKRLLNDEDSSVIRFIYNKYYISSFIAILASGIGSIISNIIVGNSLGQEKLAVMSLVVPVFYVFATIGNLAGIGGSIFCGNLIGARRDDECKKVYTTTYLFMLLSSLLFTVLFLLFQDPIIRLLGTTDELFQDTKDYYVIMVIGGFFTGCTYLAFNFLRLDGHTFGTTLAFIISGGVTILLDILLTVIFDFGILGVSIATSTGAMAATIYSLILIGVKSEELKFVRVTIKEFFTYLRSIFRIGSPGGSENVSILLKSYLLNAMILSFLSSAALSSLSVVSSVNSFSQSIILGGAGALCPLISIFSSERDPSSIKKTVICGTKVCMLTLFVFMGVCFSLSPQIVNVFGISSNDDIFQETVHAVRLFTLSLPLNLVANYLIYIHIANDHTILANILTTLRNFIFVIISAFILMKFMGSTGLWMSYLATEVGTILAAIVGHIITKKKNPDLSPVLLLDRKVEKQGYVFSRSIQDSDEEISGALDELRDFVIDIPDLNKKRKMIVTLAMEEMLYMIREHALVNAKNHTISFRILIYNDVLVLRIRTRGEIFNPIEYYKEKQEKAEDSIDGLLNLDDSMGIKMVVDTCDVVDYRSTFGINNLTIIL